MDIMMQKNRSKKTTSKPAIAYIATAIKAARTHKGLSQRALSEKIGIPQGHLSKIENGEVDPRLSSAIEIARALDYEVIIIPRALLPAIGALKQGAAETAQPNDENVRLAIQKLAQVNTDAAKLARTFPDSKELQKFLTTIRELQRYRLDTQYASRIKDVLEQIRPTLSSTSTFQQIYRDGINKLNMKKQLEQISKITSALQQTRNALAHGAIDTSESPTPAYQLSDGDN
jgi:transcriptional regulator with XRE-family HTH domain